jgi:hypothetical protein
MANMWTTVVIVKSKEYLNIATATTDYDADLTRLIEEVTARMIDYLDNDDISASAGNDILKCACAKQVTYEWLRKKESLGVTSTTFPDGSVSKMTIDEWLPEVKQILQREMEYAI